MKLVSVSCEFNAGTLCEAKFELDSSKEYGGEFWMRIPPEEAEQLKIGDVYSIHIRRL